MTFVRLLRSAAFYTLCSARTLLLLFIDIEPAVTPIFINERKGRHHGNNRSYNGDKHSLVIQWQQHLLGNTILGVGSHANPLHSGNSSSSMERNLRPHPWPAIMPGVMATPTKDTEGFYHTDRTGAAEAKRSHLGPMCGCRRRILPPLSPHRTTTH